MYPNRWLLCLICAVYGIASLVHVSLAEEVAVELYISEIMFDPSGPDAGREWVELVNLGSDSLVLADFTLGDEEKAGGNEGAYRFPANAVIDPGEIVVVAQSAHAFLHEYGRLPNYELVETHSDVPQMRAYPLLASGEMQLANVGDELLLRGARFAIIDRVGYGDSQITDGVVVEIGAQFKSGQTIVRDFSNCTDEGAVLWRTARSPSPGTIDLPDPPVTRCEETGMMRQPPFDQIDNGVPHIAQLRQTAVYSTHVHVQGTVVGQHVDRNASGVTYFTLFVQDGRPSPEAAADFSSGLAIFSGRRRLPYTIGDRLTISGQLIDFYGMMEIQGPQLEIEKSSGFGKLPTAVDLSSIPAEQYEKFESMRVIVPHALVIGPTFLSDSACGFTITAHVDQPEHNLTIWAADERQCEQILEVKRGDRITQLAGILVYRFDAYGIILQAITSIEEGELPLVEPLMPAVHPTIRLATLNVQNHFDNERQTDHPAEPIVTVAAIEQKEQKLAYAITNQMGCPTLIAIQEVETAGLMQGLADKASAQCGFRYGIVHLESYDGRGIDNGLLYEAGRVEINHFQLHQTCTGLPTDVNGYTCPEQQFPLFSRPPLQIDANVDGQEITIFVNHLKSKRGGEAETALRRRLQAEFLADQAAVIDRPVMVVGDFNDTPASESWTAVMRHGLHDALAQVPAAERYSYNFGGQQQLIDGVFVSPELFDQVAAVEILHLNADFPATWQNDPEMLDYRFSDHDIPIVDFHLPQAYEPDPVLTPPIAGEMPVSSATSESSTGAEQVEGNRMAYMIVVLTLIVGILLGWGFGRKSR